MSSKVIFKIQVTLNTIETTIGFLLLESIVLFISNIYLLFLEKYFEVRDRTSLNLVFNSY